LGRCQENYSKKWLKESQYVFFPGRGTVDAIYVVRQVMQTSYLNAQKIIAKLSISVNITSYSA